MFSPHHQFANCLNLEGTISHLRDNGNVPDQIFTNYKKYHFSLIHKLKCAKSYTENINDLFSNIPSFQAVGDMKDFIFKVNMYLDGFFFSGGSALDIFAREVLTYFDSIPSNQDVYYHTARNIIRASNPTEPLLSRLNDPRWKRNFSNYRNSLTHELIIVGEFQYNVRIDGAGHTQQLIIPLPDNPRLDINNRTYRTNTDVVVYCNTHLKRILKLINVIYGDLCQRINAQGSLPL